MGEAAHVLLRVQAGDAPPAPTTEPWHVWVVYRDVSYQGAELLGVYASAEVAMAAHAPPDPLPIWCTSWQQCRAPLSEGGGLLPWWMRDDGGDTINAERYQVHSTPPTPGGDKR